MKTSTTKTTAAEKKAALVARYAEMAPKASAAMNNSSNHVIPTYQAVEQVVHFATHNEVGAPVAFIVGCQEWLNGHKAAYETATAAKAWATLPERMRKWAGQRTTKIDQFVERMTKARTDGYGMLNALSWSDDAFKATAEFEAIMSMAAKVEEAIAAGMDAEQGFAETEKIIAEQCKRRGMSISRSTSPTSNIAEDAERVAWFTIAERMEWFRRMHDIW
jgi:hypothetical protein